MEWVDILGNALRSAFGPQAAVYALAAIGLNMHYGYTGLLNFGQVGFMLVGAYGLGITVATFGGTLLTGVVVGLVAGVVLALLLGIPTLRLRADYFAITTIAVAEILRLVVRSSDAQPITGGAFGLQGIANAFYFANPIPPGRYGPGMLAYTDQTLWMVLVTWTLAGLCTLLLWLLIRSPWGRVIKAIREDEDAARSLGKNVFAYKMQSLVIGGVIAALGGIMFAIAGSTVNADTWLPTVTFLLYTILILGGAASTAGPLIGSVIFWFLFAGIDAFLRQAESSGLISSGVVVGAVSFALVGLGLMLLMIYRPQGIFGSRREMMLDV